MDKFSQIIAESRYGKVTDERKSLARETYDRLWAEVHGNFCSEVMLGDPKECSLPYPEPKKPLLGDLVNVNWNLTPGIKPVDNTPTFPDIRTSVDHRLGYVPK